MPLDPLAREAAWAGVAASELSPYRGLEAFREQDARWMFGRDDEVAALLDSIRTGQTRFLTLIGASGSGKSSLLMGGLCPMLRSGVLGDGVAWNIAYLRPGARPCEALAHALVNFDARGDAIADGLAVKRLRAALGDDADNPRFVETLPRRGYRFLATVQIEDAEAPSEPAAGVNGDLVSRLAQAVARELSSALNTSTESPDEGIRRLELSRVQDAARRALASTLDGLAEIRAAGREAGFLALCGVELVTDHGHYLCYFPDPAAVPAPPQMFGTTPWPVRDVVRRVREMGGAIVAAVVPADVKPRSPVA